MTSGHIASNLPSSLVLVGAGKMGGAMLRGWLALGMPGRSITAIDPYAAADMRASCADYGVRLTVDATGVGSPEVLVLAIKPQTLPDASAALRALIGPQTLVVSIMAGKTIADIERATGAQSIVRTMPNTPAAIGRGVTGAAASPAVSLAQRTQATGLLDAVGRTVWLDDEKLIDAVTAVSGSGPAYVFYLAECLARAGEAAGLPANLAMQLARATVEGSGELMYREPQTSASQLRVNVTSPGGTTAAALDVLMADDGLEPLMRRAIDAAKRRAGELSG